MISKSSKFPTRVQFLTFRAKATQSATPHLRFMISPRTQIEITKGQTDSRLSVIVPIKVNKRATTRNHYKRLVYDTVWKILAGKKTDCIIMFKPIPLVKGQSSDDLILSELSHATL